MTNRKIFEHRPKDFEALYRKHNLKARPGNHVVKNNTCCALGILLVGDGIKTDGDLKVLLRKTALVEFMDDLQDFAFGFDMGCRTDVPSAIFDDNPYRSYGRIVAEHLKSKNLLVESI